MRGNAIFLRNQWISTWMAWILAIWHKCMHVHHKQKWNDDKLHTIFIINDKELKIYLMIFQCAWKLTKLYEINEISLMLISQKLIRMIQLYMHHFSK